ncbi:MAG: NAD-dependent deacylase [Candidatus Cloacimonadaceae bacterium]|nr:NAD-dependent deacylase [Candidatus Cloacimonadaceae bacterium]MDP3114020.1 NAD-dependent deacylase [Candidatus Cloacimonadaceae bacterium]
MTNSKPLPHIVALTGAGISAESGIRTFRETGGLWENHKIEDVATPSGFKKDPALVWAFYKERYRNALNSKPNAGHLALVDLESMLQDRFQLITQNVDGLHSAAGNKHVLEMHGSLHRSFCISCKAIFAMTDIDLDMSLPKCVKCGANLRPDIVWFGEIPYALYEIEKIIKDSEIFLIIGTSGAVYPAAGFVMTAKHFGAKTIAVNLDPPDNRSFIDEFYQGKAGEILPQLVKSWIN